MATSPAQRNWGVIRKRSLFASDKLQSHRPVDNNQLPSLSLSRFMAFVTLSRVLTRKVFNAPSMPNKTFLGSAAAAESKRTKWRGNNIINYTRSRCNSRSCHQIILSLKIHRLLYSPPPSSCSATFETNYPNKTPRHERERRISADVETVTRRNFMSQVLMCTRKLHSRAHS